MRHPTPADFAKAFPLVSPDYQSLARPPGDSADMHCSKCVQVMPTATGSGVAAVGADASIWGLLVGQCC